MTAKKRKKPCDCGAKDEDGKVIEHFSPRHGACPRGEVQKGEKGCPLLCSHEEVSLNDGCEVRDYIQYVVETSLNSVPTQYTPAESPCSDEELYQLSRRAFAERVCCLYNSHGCIEYAMNRPVVQRAARESRGLGSKPSSLIASWFHDIIFGRVEPCDCGAKDEDGDVIEHFSPTHRVCLRGGKQRGEKGCPLLCSHEEVSLNDGCKVHDFDASIIELLVHSMLTQYTPCTPAESFDSILKDATDRFNDIIFERVEPCDCGAKDKDGNEIVHSSTRHGACLKGQKQKSKKGCPLLS